jgi:hypothetical protein
MHEAPLKQGLDEHSSIATVQLSPSQPAVHIHVYPVKVEVQLPPLLHGEPEHWSSVSVQLRPNHPVSQLHKYEPTPSMHVPPF